MELKNLAWERSFISLFQVNPVGLIVVAINHGGGGSPY